MLERLEDHDEALLGRAGRLAVPPPTADVLFRDQWDLRCGVRGVRTEESSGDSISEGSHYGRTAPGVRSPRRNDRWPNRSGPVPSSQRNPLPAERMPELFSPGALSGEPGIDQDEPDSKTRS